jgi:hypothetical protein
MSEPTSAYPPPRGIRALHRFGLGALSLLRIALVVLAVLAVNYLAFHQYGRVDLSRRAEYSLSPATISYLESATMRGRETPVRWVMCFRRTAPLYERVRALAEEYARRSGGRVVLEVVDPLRSPDRMQEVIAAYGLTLVRDMIIVDARPDDAVPAIREDANQIKTLHPNVRLLLGEDVITHAVEDGKRSITGFRGEDVMTSRLMEAVEGKPKRMALLVDKTRFQTDAADSPLRGLAERMRWQNIELVALSIAAIPEIPTDIDGVAIVAPVFDFTETEIAMLEAYWARPRSALLVLSDSSGVPSRLKAFLRAQGITPHKDRVVMPKDKRISTEVAATFAQGVPFLGGLAGQSTLWEGGSASIEVREGAEDLLAKKVYPIGVIDAHASAWGETEFGTGREVFDETEDHAAPVHLAAICTRGAEMDDRYSESTSRMVVVANTDFLAPQASTRAENLGWSAVRLHWGSARVRWAHSSFPC